MIGWILGMTRKAKLKSINKHKEKLKNLTHDLISSQVNQERLIDSGISKEVVKANYKEMDSLIGRLIAYSLKRAYGGCAEYESRILIIKCTEDVERIIGRDITDKEEVTRQIEGC